MVFSVFRSAVYSLNFVTRNFWRLITSSVTESMSFLLNRFCLVVWWAILEIFSVHSTSCNVMKSVASLFDCFTNLKIGHTPYKMPNFPPISGFLNIFSLFKLLSSQTPTNFLVDSKNISQFSDLMYELISNPCETFRSLSFRLSLARRRNLCLTFEARCLPNFSNKEAPKSRRLLSFKTSLPTSSSVRAFAIK